MNVEREVNKFNPMLYFVYRNVRLLRVVESVIWARQARKVEGDNEPRTLGGHERQGRQMKHAGVGVEKKNVKKGKK